MIRISGVNIPENKSIEYALCYIYGMGLALQRRVLAKFNISPTKKAKDLSQDEVTLLREEIQDNYVVEGELRKKVAMDIKRFMDMGCYRGLRHRKHLPVRGQRTHTNARTRKGKAVAIAGKKKAIAKK